VWTPAIVWSILLVGAIGGVLNVAVRRAPQQVTATS